MIRRYSLLFLLFYTRIYFWKRRRFLLSTLSSFFFLSLSHWLFLSLSHWLFLSPPLLDHQTVWLNWASFSGNCFTNWPPLWRRDWTFLSSSSSLFSPSPSFILSPSFFLLFFLFHSFFLPRNDDHRVQATCMPFLFPFPLSSFLSLSLSILSFLHERLMLRLQRLLSLSTFHPLSSLIRLSTSLPPSSCLPLYLTFSSSSLPLLFILSSLSIFILSWEKGERESLFLTLWTFITCFVTCIETGSCNTLGRWGPPPPFSSES